MGEGGQARIELDPVLDDFDQMVDRLVGLAQGGGLLGCGDGRLIQVMQRFERSRNRLAGVDDGWVAAVVERDLPVRLVSGSPTRLLTSVLRLSPAEASGRVRASEALMPGLSSTGQPVPPVRPLLAAAQTLGGVGTKQVAVIESALRKVHPSRVRPGRHSGRGRPDR